MKHLTQAKLAELVGVTEQYLSMIERGLSSPSFDVIAKLCDCLSVDPAGLFLPSAEPAPRDEKQAEKQTELVMDWSRSLIRMGAFSQELPGEHQEWTLSLKEMLGVRLSEEGTDWDLFLARVVDEDRQAVADVRDRLSDGMEVGVFRFDFLRHDGSRGQALACAEVESDEYGTPSRVRCLILDISERVRMEGLLQQSRESLGHQLRERTSKLARTARRMEEESLGRKTAEAALDRKTREMNAMLDAVPDVLYLLDAEGRITALNPAAARSWGAPAETFLGRDRFHLLDEEVATFRRSRLEMARESGGMVRYRDVREDRTFESVVNPVIGPDRTTAGFVVHARDVTADDLAVARLRQSEATLAAVLSSAPVGIGLVGQDRILSMANYRLSEMLGYLPADLEGKNTRMLYETDEEYHRVARVIHPALAGHGMASVETRMVRRDGGVIDVLLSSALLEPGDLSAGIIFTLLDITEQKRLRTLRDDMERVIRHDLRQPVQSVVGVCQLLGVGDNLTDKQRMLVSRLEAAATRMLELLNLSLDLHALESGDYRMEPARVDLARLCREVMAEAVQRYGRQAGDLLLMLNGEPCGDSDEVLVNGDVRLLRSVLENLVQNAIEAGDQAGGQAGIQGPVTVSLQNGRELSVSVHNPQPVPEAIRGSFFDKYVTCEKENGRGLGTYAVRLIAELHGGSVHMDCSERAGTTVTVRLPGHLSA